MGVLTWQLGFFCLGLLGSALAEKAPLSIVKAREDASTLSTFTLLSNVTSTLFSSCLEKANTVEGSLHSIEVDDDVWYTRYLIDSGVEVTWEVAEGENSIIECANKAYGAESKMFMHADNVCTLSIDGIYNPRNASCDGQEVFIMDPLDVCFTSFGENEAGHTYYEWTKCKTLCADAGILKDEMHGNVDPNSIPEKVLDCCPNALSPCLYSDGARVPPCEAERYCYFLGMTLPEAVRGAAVEQLLTLFPSDLGSPDILVNVKFENSQFVHRPSGTPVTDDEWDDTPPTDEQFICLDRNRLLKTVTSTEDVLVVCQEKENLPKCSEVK